MTADLPAPRRTRASLSVQIVALLIVSVVLAQAVTAVLILLLPAPRPPVYRLSELATALKGGSLQTSSGWRLTRVRLAKGAPEASGRSERDDRLRNMLAAMINVPDERVQLTRIHRGRSDPGRVVSTMFRAPPGPPPHLYGRPDGGDFPRGGWRPPPSRDHGPPRPPGSDPGPPPDGGAPRPWEPRGDFPRGGDREADCRPGLANCQADPLLFQAFTASLVQPDGGRIVVRPAPEPFPNDWQARILLWLAISLALVAPMGYLFARRITAPLAAFARAADSFGKDPASPLMVMEGPAEIGVAARAFNDMQGRLKRYVEDRTAMVGAISHDLRTPLARIRFKLERAPPELRTALVSDVAQMEQMISAVLAFIRDASAASTREPLDLLSLLECTADDAAIMGADASIEADWSPIVDGDAVALQRLFANLVDNAVKYGGSARISLHRVDGDVRVDIRDHGPGLPEAELERVFDAFYRADRSRNLDDGGIGLGLAVARTVAREHGGDVYLSTGDGLTAHVELPLRREASGPGKSA